MSETVEFALRFSFSILTWMGIGWLVFGFAMHEYEMKDVPRTRHPFR